MWKLTHAESVNYSCKHWGLSVIPVAQKGTASPISAAAAAAATESLQSCLTLCDPIGASPPGPTVPGIFQARVLEWVAIAFSNCF